MPTTLSIPAWIFDHPGEHFLVVVRPDGTARVDGGHGSPTGVTKARTLHEQISLIRPPEGSRYVMVTIAAVPDGPAQVNEEAIATLNALAPASPRPSSPEGV